MIIYVILLLSINRTDLSLIESNIGNFSVSSLKIIGIYVIAWFAVQFGN